MAVIDDTMKALGLGTDKAKTSGAFGHSKQQKQLGGNYADFLIQRLGQDPTESPLFSLGADLIRDTLTQQSATARQRFGDASVQGGYMDSGVVTEGLIDIQRNEDASYASELTKLLIAVEERREQNVLPFLSGASQEHLQVKGMNIQAQSNLQSSVADMFSFSKIL
jgi:hypothetical protein